MQFLSLFLVFSVLNILNINKEPNYERILVCIQITLLFRGFNQSHIYNLTMAKSQLIILVTGVLATVVFGERASFPQTSSLCRNQSTSSGVFRFHNETRQCYQIGQQGPCSQLMIFYADPLDDDYGSCDCDLKLRCHRPMVYSPVDKRCYLAYEQGPCEDDSYLVIHHDYEATCELNPCKKDGDFNEFEMEEDSNEFWFHVGNQCIHSGTQGLCPLSNQKTIFNGFSKHVHPVCSHVTFTCTLPEFPSLLCVPGQKFFLQDKCGLSDPNLNPYFMHRFNHHSHSHQHHRRHFNSQRRHRHHHHRHNTFSDNGNNFRNTTYNNNNEPLEPYRSRQDFSRRRS